MKISGADGLIVPVQDAFWPIFFAGPLDVRWLGQSVLFSVFDFSLRNQLVLVYPERGATSLPSMREILDALSSLSQTDELQQPLNLPAHIRDLYNADGVEIDTLRASGRTMVLLTPVWDADTDACFADSRLISLRICGKENDEVISGSEDHLLLYQRHKPQFGLKEQLLLIRDAKAVDIAVGLKVAAVNDNVLILGENSGDLDGQG